MTKPQKRLLALIAVELLAGGFLLLRARSRPAPPVPELSHVDPIVGEQIRAQAANCRTADEWAALGETYLAFGYFAEGEACAREAARRDPKSAKRAYEWGFALERIGKLEEANAEYERAAARDPATDADCRYYIGRNFLRMEKVDLARAAFAAAAGHASCEYELGRLLHREGNDTPLMTMLLKLGSQHPRAFAPLFLAHRIEVLKKNGIKAAMFSDRAALATERLPTPFDKDWKRLEDVFFRLGVTNELKAIEGLLAAGKVAEAEPRVRALIAKDWSGSAADLLAEVEVQRRRPAEALRILQEAVEREGPSAHLLGRLGDAYELNGKTNEAVAAWTRGAELGVGAAVKNLHFKLGEHHEKANNPTSAKWHQSRACLAAGHEQFWGGQYANAKQLFEEAVRIEPRLAAAWFYLGETHRRVGDDAAAKKAYAACLERDPNFGRAIAAAAR